MPTHNWRGSLGKLINIPSVAKTVPVGQKRKRGRPALAIKSLEPTCEEFT